MNTKYKFLVVSSLSLALLAGAALSASAEDSMASGTVRFGNAASTTLKFRAGLGIRMQNASTTWAKDLSKMIDRGEKEIDRRIDALNKLNDRIQSAKRVSDAGKSDISLEVQAQITDLTTLRAKIAADTDEATLRADLKSITASHRIFALVMPQAAITAAAFRIETIANDLKTIETKLQTRITAAQTAGKDVTVLNATLNRITAELADALTQAQAAKDKVASLKPDNGDKTTADANRAALLAARADIKVGTTDLQSARKDAESIIVALKTPKSGDKNSSKTEEGTTTQTTASTTTQ
ncbi:MAG: hypothetical protein PHV42_02360 [Candidatus Pacebacteria bacterium]|nr:hypothetical protein [Candidatus Paceibacterota bacterium]